MKLGRKAGDGILLRFMDISTLIITQKILFQNSYFLFV